MKALTIGILAVAVAVMAFAGMSAPKTDATPSLCHSTTLSISAAASVKSGSKLTVTGREARTPAHTVTAPAWAPWTLISLGAVTSLHFANLQARSSAVVGKPSVGGHW